jgi:hypothetical protein
VTDLDAAWRELAQQIDWSDQFWLGWLFVEAGPDEAALRQRTAAAVAAQGQALVDLPIDHDASLRAALESFGEASPRLSWARLRAAGDEGARLWSWLHLRLNERRELVRRNSPGGLVLVGPPALKIAARDAAPDLWSARSLLIELAPRPAPIDEAAPVPPRLSLPHLQAHEAGLFTAGGGRSAAVRALLDDALRALEAGKADEAYTRADDALRKASAPADAALAALRAAEALTVQGRADEALPLLERSAAEAREALAPTLAWAALIRLANQHHRAGATAPAAAAAAEARSWAARVPDPDEALRRGALTSQLQGEIAAQQGALDVAARHLGAAVDEGRAYLARVGPVLGAVGPLANALSVLSAVERSRGALDAAVVAAQEAVKYAQKAKGGGLLGQARAAAERGALITLSRAQIARGGLTEAQRAAEQAVALARQVEAPDRPAALGEALWCLAEVHRAGHAWARAGAAAREAAEVYRAAMGRPGAGADLDLRWGCATALHLQSVAELAQGALTTAVNAAAEGVALCRGAHGPARAQRALATSLAQLCAAQLDAGQLTAAAAHTAELVELREGPQRATNSGPDGLRERLFARAMQAEVGLFLPAPAAAGEAAREAVDHARALRATRGALPDTTRDLALALERRAAAAQAQGEHTTARAAADEALALHRELQAFTAEMPELVADLAEALTLRARLSLDAGEAAEAREAAAEALTLVDRWAANGGPAARAALFSAEAHAVAAAADLALGAPAAAARSAAAGLAALDAPLDGQPPALRAAEARITLHDHAAQAAAAQGALPAALDAARAAVDHARAWRARWPTARDSRPSLAAVLERAAALAAAAGLADEAAAWAAEAAAAR